MHSSRADAATYRNVGAEPIAVLPARIVGIEDEQNVRLTKSSLADSHSEGSVTHPSTSRANEVQQSQEHVLRDGLMFIGWHREDLDRAVGEFNQSPAVVGQLEVLLFGPEALDWSQIQNSVVVRRCNPQSASL
jgi:hypothetical protein